MDLGVSEKLIHKLTLGLEPEDGVIWVCGANDDDGILLSPMIESLTSAPRCLSDHGRRPARLRPSPDESLGQVRIDNLLKALLIVRLEGE